MKTKCRDHDTGSENLVLMDDVMCTGSDEESEHDREWEAQQIKKGVAVSAIR